LIRWCIQWAIVHASTAEEGISSGEGIKCCHQLLSPLLPYLQLPSIDLDVFRTYIEPLGIITLDEWREASRTLSLPSWHIRTSATETSSTSALLFPSGGRPNRLPQYKSTTHRRCGGVSCLCQSS
jgi:hypothetical protein